MDCPNCHKSMNIASYNSETILYKCPDLECGFICLVDGETGVIKQQWNRNDVSKLPDKEGK